MEIWPVSGSENSGKESEKVSLPISHQTDKFFLSSSPWPHQPPRQCLHWFRGARLEEWGDIQALSPHNPHPQDPQVTTGASAARTAKPPNRQGKKETDSTPNQACFPSKTEQTVAPPMEVPPSGRAAQQLAHFCLQRYSNVGLPTHRPMDARTSTSTVTTPREGKLSKAGRENKNTAHS